VNCAVGKCVFEFVYWQKKCDCLNEENCNKHVTIMKFKHMAPILIVTSLEQNAI
jgi:hypothetical protein